MSVVRTRTRTTEYSSPRSLSDSRAEFVEVPGTRNRAARGVIAGALLGAGLWGVILIFAGVIKF